MDRHPRRNQFETRGLVQRLGVQKPSIQKTKYTKDEERRTKTDDWTYRTGTGADSTLFGENAESRRVVDLAYSTLRNRFGSPRGTIFVEIVVENGRSTVNGIEAALIAEIVEL